MLAVTFEVRMSKNSLIWAANVSALTVFAVDRPVPLCRVSRSVFCILNYLIVSKSVLLGLYSVFHALPALFEVWNMASCECLTTIKGEGQVVKALAEVGGGRLASGFANGCVKVWMPFGDVDAS